MSHVALVYARKCDRMASTPAKRRGFRTLGKHRAPVGLIADRRLRAAQNLELFGLQRKRATRQHSALVGQQVVPELGRKLSFADWILSAAGQIPEIRLGDTVGVEYAVLAVHGEGRDALRVDNLRNAWIERRVDVDRVRDQSARPRQGVECHPVKAQRVVSDERELQREQALRRVGELRAGEHRPLFQRDLCARAVEDRDADFGHRQLFRAPVAVLATPQYADADGGDASRCAANVCSHRARLCAREDDADSLALRMALDEHELQQRISAVQGQLKLLADALDRPTLVARVEALESEMGAEGFWDDQEKAAKINAEYSRANRKVEEFDAVSSEVEDLTALAEMAAEDESMADELEEQLADLEKRMAVLEEERLFSGEYDAGDAVVTIQDGAGGTDAQDWAEMVLRMMTRWAEGRGFKVELKEVNAGQEAGITRATFLVHGENAYGLFAAERGVHRLVRLSPFDSAHRRQTSFAGVEVAPLVDDDLDVEIDESDLQIDTYRASGAGGQHVNKTDSAVRITHRPTGIVVQCQDERSQGANKNTAMKMLRARIVALEEEKRAAELAAEKGEAIDVNFGSQIRSYVLHPYSMVKDHRTNFEMGDVQRVLDGDLDGFVHAELSRRAAGRPSERAGSAKDG